MNFARRPFSETGQNGRSEENGNFSSFDDENTRLQTEVELIYRKLIESGDLPELRELMTRNLYKGIWKHEVSALCKDAAKKQNPISFEVLYNSVKECAKGKIDSELKERMIDEVKNRYQKAVESLSTNIYSAPIRSHLTE